MATEQLPTRVQQPTTIRFFEDLRKQGERIAQEMGLKFTDVVRLGLAALIRHEDKNRTEAAWTS